MRYLLRNMPKRRACLHPWFANFFLEITGPRLTSRCETNEEFRFKVRRNGGLSRDAQNLQYYPPPVPWKRGVNRLAKTLST